jgi:hypothetical protein
MQTYSLNALAESFEIDRSDAAGGGTFLTSRPCCKRTRQSSIGAYLKSGIICPLFLPYGNVKSKKP